MSSIVQSKRENVKIECKSSIKTLQFKCTHIRIVHSSVWTIQGSDCLFLRSYGMCKIFYLLGISIIVFEANSNVSLQ